MSNQRKLIFRYHVQRPPHQRSCHVVSENAGGPSDQSPAGFLRAGRCAASGAAGLRGGELYSPGSVLLSLITVAGDVLHSVNVDQTLLFSWKLSPRSVCVLAGFELVPWAALSVPSPLQISSSDHNWRYFLSCAHFTISLTLLTLGSRARACALTTHHLVGAAPG